MTERFVRRSAAVAARRLGDELVIISALDSSLFTLNETAALIWEAADGVTPLDEIVERVICAEYAVPPSEAREDVYQFVTELARHGILQIHERPPPPPEAP